MALIRYGVSNGDSVYSMFDTPQEAETAGIALTKADGVRRWVVRVVTLRRITPAAPPPDPIVVDE